MLNRPDMSKKIVVKPTVVDILKNFGEWTSISTLPHIAAADTLCIALFWAIVFVGCGAIMVYLIYVSIHKFLSFPTELNPRILHGQQDFPCLTICNVSPWKASKVVGTDLQDLISAYNANNDSSTYGFTRPFTMKESLRAKRWTQFMFEQLKEADVNGSKHLSFDFFNDLVINCEYLQQNCNFSGNFDLFYDAYYGKCVTLNSNATWKTTRAGPNYGLRLTLRSPIEEYLPWIQTSGIVFYIHGTNETPFEDAFGYMARVGRATSVGVKYFERKKLGGSYSNCVDDSTVQDNYYDNDYEVEACLRSCLQDTIISYCSCYDPQYNYPSNVNVSSCYKAENPNEKLDCADKIINENGVTNTPDSFTISSCECPPSCDQSYYQISMSTASWPARNYIPSQCARPSITSSYSTTTSECLSWYKNNTVLLEIYFERTSWQTSVEDASYTWVNLLSDVGGQLSLWLGLSAVNVFELVALVGILGAFVILKPNPPDLIDFDYFDQFDNQLKQHERAFYKFNKDDTHTFPPPITEAAQIPTVVELQL